MKKLIYLIVIIVAFGLIVPGCLPVVPPTEQDESSSLTKGGTTWTVGPSGPPTYDYTTIQAAIDAASPGETINVAAGTYYETISITTDDLTIQSVSGNPLDTIIDPTVNIAHCSGVTLSGFTITSSKHWGLFLNYAVNCKFYSIIISDIENPSWDSIGLYLIASTDNSFNNIEISNVTSTALSAYALYLQYGCDRNTFTSTKISNIEGKIGTMGIVLQLGNSNNSFKSTEISNITVIDDRTASAIVFFNGLNNQNEFNATTISYVKGGTAIGSTYGIILLEGQENFFSEYDISGLTGGGKVHGIDLRTGAKSNSFNSGSVSGTKCGIYLTGDCNGNSIHSTNIVDNTEYGAYSEKAILDATCNWWGDDSGPSVNGPGIGDAVSTNVDFNPWLTYTSSLVYTGAPQPENSVVLEATLSDSASNGISGMDVEFYLDGDIVGSATTVSDGVASFDIGQREVGIYEVYAKTVCDLTSDKEYLAVYDLSEGSGFVTGGGWIDSPAGAYIADETLSGKACFGFVSKYKKGQSAPTGNTEFQFKAGDLNFHSDSYDWLVVAGAKAMYKGIGTINGTGEYGFMLSATDSDPDLFRIKIQDKNNDNVIYDNHQDGTEGTIVAGGQIIIHKGK